MHVTSHDEHNGLAEIKRAIALRQGGLDGGKGSLDLLAQVLLEKHVLAAAGDRATRRDKQVGGDGFINPLEDGVFVAANDAGGLQDDGHADGQGGDDQTGTPRRPHQIIGR